MGALRLIIRSRTGRDVLPDGIMVPDTATVGDLKARFAELKPKYYPSRQRFTLPPQSEGARSGTALADAKRLVGDYGLQDGSVLVFKDLGPQIGYRTVFVWEYFGPLVVYPLFYFLPWLFYPGLSVPSPRPLAQTLALAYWSLHYIKRIAETFFVHTFSHGTMPVFNLLKNSSYYWGFAAFVSYFVNHPLLTPPPESVTIYALAIGLLCELGNLRCHIILTGLRSGASASAGTKTRAGAAAAPSAAGAYSIPRGFLFNYITCANYTCEIAGWICFTVATHTLSAAIFTLVGAAQMAQWAVGKHKRLLKLFDGREGREKYPRRWIMLPPFF